MTKFEKIVNGGQFEKNTIECVIIDLSKNDTFHATINGSSLYEVNEKLPMGYELCVISTLKNYFDHKLINEYENELKNDAYIYSANFNDIIETLYGYIKIIEFFKTK